MILKLHYNCTETEIKEAKALQEREHYGRGSKWRARLVLGGLLALTLVGAGVRFSEVAPQDRLWFIATAVVVFVALVVVKRITRRQAGGEVRLEVSEREVIFGGGEGRTAMQWAGFSQCLESPNLFVLVDRAKATLFVLPKRAFPDETAQNWFRTQANQPKSPAATVPDEPLVPGRFVSANGIALTLRLKFRDYLIRNLTSWRMKGMFFGMLALLTAINFLSTHTPGAENSAWKTFLIMTPMFMGIMMFVIVVVSFLTWHAEKKHSVAQQIVVTDDGIEFVTRDASGRLAWSTYKYYLENHWSFFVWHPQGSVWLMFPKREFSSASDLVQLRGMLETKLKKSRWFYL